MTKIKKIQDFSFLFCLCVWGGGGRGGERGGAGNAVVDNLSEESVRPNCKVSRYYIKGYSSYGTDTKLHLKSSTENNSKSMKAIGVILVRDILMTYSI